MIFSYESINACMKYRQSEYIEYSVQSLTVSTQLTNRLPNSDFCLTQNPNKCSQRLEKCLFITMAFISYTKGLQRNGTHPYIRRYSVNIRLFENRNITCYRPFLYETAKWTVDFISPFEFEFEIDCPLSPLS